MNVEQLFSYDNLIIILAIIGVGEGFKKSFAVAKINETKAVKILLPWMPLILGAIAGVIPGVIGQDWFGAAPKAIAAVADGAAAEPEGIAVGVRIVVGVALGMLSGHVWKIVKTKIDALKGNL